MSYAPSQSEPSLNHRNPFPNKTSVARRYTARKSAPTNRKSTFGRRHTSGEAEFNSPILVHCHLCWDWVWQRPQQFISRLSRRHKTLFVETVGPDPELAAPLVRFRTVTEFPNVTVLRLQFPNWEWEDGDYVDVER